ncbi:MAG: phage/plasmid primase, P4 family [Terricaulis sp.]
MTLFSMDAHYLATDAANGDRFAGACGERFRHITRLGWLWFDGTRWTLDDAREKAREAAKSVALSIATERWPIATISPTKWATRSLSSKALDNMLECARTQMLARPEDFDREPNVLNVGNATLRFSRRDDSQITVARSSHNASDMKRRKALADLDLKARAPVWKRHIERVLPDPSVRSYAQRVMGYVMLGSRKEQVIFFCLGDGGDGKTTTLNAIAAAMGDYAATMDIAKLLDSPVTRDAEAPTPMLASLDGDVRFVTCAEPPTNARLNEALIKHLTGGAKIRARALKGASFEHTPRYTIFVECNSPPRIIGKDRGIWRRIRVIPWTAQIAQSAMDPDLGDKLAQESSGILNWLIEGAKEYLHVGLAEPDAIVRCTEALRGRSQSGLAWSETVTAPDESSALSQIDLWRSYRRFCSDRSLPALQRGAFVSQLPALGFKRRTSLDSRSRRVVWSGRKLTACGVRLTGRCEETSAESSALKCGTLEAVR